MCNTEELIRETCCFFSGDPKRVHHFLKVYAFAKAIGAAEKLPPREQTILETAAILHDVGIRPSEEKYGSSAGKYQELEGPPVAEDILRRLDWPADICERVCFLIGHHHTYDAIDGPDYQILVEADFLVNAYEDGLPREKIETAGQKLFRTTAGRALLQTIYYP